MAAMEFAAKHFFDGIDAIVPIPLSKRGNANADTTKASK